MMYAQIILGLVATASAIDTYFHLGNNCDGPAIVCTGLNPGICCTASVSNSLGYRGIPTDWVITAEAFFGSGCGISAGSQTARNTNFLCFHRSLTGTRYRFSSKKRGEAGIEASTCSDADEPCTSSQKANELVLLDGTRYNIVDLEEGALDELVCYTSVTILLYHRRFLS